MKKSLLAILVLMLAVLIVLPIFAAALPGDINGNGTVDENDSVLLARYLAGWNVNIDETSANVTGDDKVDEFDAVLLGRYLAGWNVELKMPDVPIDPHYTIYVAKNGSDETGRGTIDKPFATIERAREKVQAVLAGDVIPEDITVFLREGIYQMEETFELTEEDSGSESCPITYRAYEGERAELTGAKIVDQSMLVPARDEIKNLIRDENAREHIYEIELEKLGITYQNSASELTFYKNGETLVPARYPNIDAEDGGYLRIQTAPNGLDGTKWEGLMYGSWVEVGNVVKYWESCKGVKLDGFFILDYSRSEGTVVDYDPVENRLIVAANGSDGGRFFYSNVLYELDAPGEYYVDADTDVLYIYAYEGMENDVISCAQLNGNIVELNGADYITFDNLVFSGSLKNAIVANSEHFTLQNSEILNIKEVGVEVNGYYGTIYNNVVHNLGSVGVRMNLDYEIQVPCHGLICNNDIYDYALIGKNYHPGIHSYGTCLTVCHNEIHDSPAQAMLAGGNDIVVEYNNIYHVCRESGDAGAIYTGGWDSNNNIYRYNYIHDMMESSGGTPSGLYCDDEGAGKIAYGNVFVNLLGNGLLFGGGQNNQVFNNLIINAGVYYDERAYGWQKPAVDYPLGVLWYRFYLSVRDQYCSRIWSLRYPWTAQMKVTNTTFWPGAYLSVADNFEVGIGYAGVQFRNNAVVRLDNKTSYVPAVFNVMADSRDIYYYDTLEEIGLVDPEGGDYSIRPDSTIFRDMPGFEDIPFHKIGRFEPED